MHALKHLFLGISLVAVVESITATEILPKDDFESVINKGLSDFMDQFGREKKAELGLEDLVEKQKLAEEERLKLEQEAKEKENFANRVTKIDECVELYKLIGESLTYRKLVDICQNMISIYRPWAPDIDTNDVLDLHPCTVLEFCILTITQYRPSANSVGGNGMMPPIMLTNIPRMRILIKEDVLKSMEFYKELYGGSHPRWGEFREM